MRDVLLPGTPEFLRRYPHQLSGGQQQRVGLAMAFACRPAVIVLDEPTTGLDVSTQAHVLQTIRELTSNHGVAALYVTHDLAVVANLADHVAVMYAGRIVEQGATLVDLCQSGPSLHSLPGGGGPRTWEWSTLGRPGRAGTVAGQAALGVLVCAALRVGHRRLPIGIPAGHQRGAGGRRPSGSLRACL